MTRARAVHAGLLWQPLQLRVLTPLKLVNCTRFLSSNLLAVTLETLAAMVAGPQQPTDSGRMVFARILITLTLVMTLHATTPVLRRHSAQQATLTLLITV